MTERIDHAAIARDTVVTMGFPYEDGLLIAHAQVHATLALVEQQRIANDLSLEIKESNDRLLDQMNDVVKIAREGWDNHNRLVAAIEQERSAS